MPFPLVAAIPAIIGALAGLPWGTIAAVIAGGASAAALINFGVPQWLATQVSQLTRQQQQQFADAAVTEQQRFLTEQQQAAGVQALQAMSVQGQAQQQAQQAQVASKEAATSAAIQAVGYVQGSAQLRALEKALTLGYATSPAFIQEMVDSVASAAEQAQARVQERADAQEATATSVVTGVAGLAGVAAPGVTVTDMAVPLTGAALGVLAPTLANSFARASHRQSISCMGTTGAAMLTNIMTAAVPTALAAGFMLNPQLQQGLTGLAAKALDLLYKPLEEMSPITPDKAPGVGTNLLLQAVLLGSGAHLMSVIAEAAAPLKHMGLGYLSAFMADMSGFSRIAAAFQGTMITWGLSQPMRYWAMQRFRPMILSERDFTSLIGRGAFDSPETLNAPGLVEAVAAIPGETGEEKEKWLMSHYGYQDPYWGFFKELGYRQLGYFALSGIARTGFYEPVWFNEALSRTGYSPTAKKQLDRMYQQEALESARGVMSGAVTKPYRLGLLADDQLELHLGNLGYQPQQVTPILYAAKLDFATEQAEEWKDLFVDQFVKGLIDEDDLGLAISSLGYRAEKVELEVQEAIIRVTPKVAREEPVQTKHLTRDAQKKLVQAYTQLYRKNQIDEDTFYVYLETTKVDPGLARATVILEAAKKLPKVEAAE